MRSLTTYCLLIALTMISTHALKEDHGDGTKCTHDHQDNPEPEFLDIGENFQVMEDGEGRNLASTYNNIRMHGYYDRLNSAPSDFKTYFKNELGPAVLSYFQGALKVKYPVTGLLKVTSSSVCSITTPTVLKSGVSADYFIMFDSTSDSGSWVAESYSCYLASGTKRPLVAKTLLNRALFKNPGTNVLLHEKNVYLLLHEMTHTLGFSNNLYKYFLTDSGKVRTGHILSKSTDLGTAKVIDVPAITDRVRKFFGCSTIAGAYMENTGSSATAGSHFERRMYPFEAMTSGLIYQQSYSEFSLAMLEATGWYVPDYAYVDPYWFGQGQGCDFLTKSCSSANSLFDDFCTGSSRGCTVQGRGGGSCSSDTRSDGCKFVHPNVNYDCENPSATSYARLPSLQTFGRTANSKCFTGTLSTSSSATKTSFCFKFNCTGSGSSTKLELTVGTKTITCSKEGTVSVSGYKGSINCPDPLTFCSTVGKPACPRNCMGRGSCVNGQCKCNSGFQGKDCGLTA